MADNEEQTFDDVLNAFYPDESTEPPKEPTEDLPADEEPEEEAVEEAVEEESEEEASEEDKEDEDGSDNLVYEINGKDYTAKDIEALESGKLMQADYTKKTQALAEDRKKFDSDVSLLSDAITKTNDLAAQLEVLVSEDDSIDWAELKEDDPEQYIEMKERADNRKSKLEEVKANNQTSNTSKVDVDAERSAMIEANPQWVEDGKATEVYVKDMTAINELYKARGWDQEQVDAVNSNAKLAQVVIDLVRANDELSESKSRKTAAKKKIKASPKAGKASASAKEMSIEEIFYPKK
ncbi:MAG: hypothetical protein ACPGUE_12045 [Marinomonas sp.]